MVLRVIKYVSTLLRITQTRVEKVLHPDLFFIKEQTHQRRAGGAFGIVFVSAGLLLNFTGDFRLITGSPRPQQAASFSKWGTSAQKRRPNDLGLYEKRTSPHYLKETSDSHSVSENVRHTCRVSMCVSVSTRKKSLN